MEIRPDSLDFSQALRGDGPRQASKTFVFPRDVTSATTGLTGYLAEFSGHDDHHLGRLEIRLDTSVTGNTVTVDGFFGLRDWSGNWDDPYDGSIDLVVVAELEPIGDKPPRPDLIITGMEFIQATQFFRASSYLDPGNVHPDNSIFQIARKNTGVRVFADWDASAGGPPIAQLTGQLVVSSGATTVTLNPINPGGAITPKRDVNINQALTNDTINFMIPAALCAGTVTVTCHVFDQAAPDQQSGGFTRTLVFVPVDPLNVFLVGVNTNNPMAAAPTQAQISTAMSMFVNTYPRGDIQQTGFTNITLNDAIGGSTRPSSGCGDAWHNLLGQLSDLRGGSSDIYFGGLPTGIACTGAVLGCSPTGHGVAAAFIDVTPAIPHEIGHALGRHHAPCKGCMPPAQNTDPDFPQYNTFNSDSIGVFGFDPTTNTVFDPASTLDFMSAFIALGCTGSTVMSTSSRWISPYTHQGLLGATVGGAAPGALVNRNAEGMVLFLRLTISRSRHVTRHCSFHYPARIQGPGACDSAFTYEFLGKDKNTLDCGPLHCLCAEGSCKCWPKEIRDAIPMPDGAHWFLVWEEDHKIYEEEITNPPKVSITGSEERDDGVLVAWESEPVESVCYIVHWYDAKQNVWRGVAPRQQTRSLLIPRSLFGRGPDLKIRVYASAGIATGFAEQTVKLKQHAPPPVGFSLGGLEPGDGSRPIPYVVSVMATDPTGAQLPNERITWYNAQGNQIARGAAVDLRTLPRGRNVIRAVVRGYGDALVAKSWLVECTAKGCVLHSAICDPPPKARPDNRPHPHPAPPPCDI